MSGTINTFWPPAHPQTPSFVAQNPLFFIFHSVGAMICHKDTSISRLIAMGRHTTVRWYLGREWSKSSFRSNYDDSFYSLNSWDLSEGVSHLFLHCHLLCTIMSHGPGIYPDMSQAVVSTGVYSWAFFCFFPKVNWCSFGEFTPPDVCTYWTNRFLEAHQCCRGSGGPCSVQLRLQGQESLWGSGPAQFVLRSNRSELGARQLVCWWWCSLFLPCATCQSACSMSWKGNLSSSAASRIKSPSNTDRSTTGAAINQGSHFAFLVQ